MSDEQVTFRRTPWRATDSEGISSFLGVLGFISALTMIFAQSWQMFAVAGGLGLGATAIAV